jgi:hypothetical protein
MPPVEEEEETALPNWAAAVLEEQAEAGLLQLQAADDSK